MAVTSGFEEFDRANVIYDLETFEVMFEDGLKYNPHTAESLAFLMFRMVKEITSGPEGIEKAVNTMKLGVQWVYPYTEAHRLSFRAYLYHIAGMMLVQDFPETLMKGAIRRAEEHNREVEDDPDAPDAADDDE